MIVIDQDKFFELIAMRYADDDPETRDSALFRAEELVYDENEIYNILAEHIDRCVGVG